MAAHLETPAIQGMPYNLTDLPDTSDPILRAYSFSSLIGFISGCTAFVSPTGTLDGFDQDFIVTYR